MKKILLLVTISIALLTANELKTINSYKKALDIAKDQNKTVLFMTSIKGCPVCDYMKDIVFERESVLEYLDKNFVVVIKDAEKESYPQRFHTMDMPTFYFVNPDTEEDIIKPKAGGSTPEKFLKLLENVINTDINSTNQITKE